MAPRNASKKAKTAEMYLNEFLKAKVRKAEQNAREKYAPQLAIARQLLVGIRRAKSLVNGHSVSKMVDDPVRLGEFVLRASERIEKELGL